MDTKLYFNKIVVIESLRERDKKTGHSLYNDLLKYADHSIEELTSSYYSIASKIEFIRILKELADRAENNGEWPFLHFEMHGSEDGLQFGNNEMILWEELYEHLVVINSATKHNLFVSVASCFGAFIFNTINPIRRAPFFSFVGSSKEVSVRDIEVNFYCFFETLIKTRNLNMALDALNYGATMQYVFFDSEDVFDRICTKWRALYDSDSFKERRYSQLAESFNRLYNKKMDKKQFDELINNQEKFVWEAKQYFLFKSNDVPQPL